MISSFTHVSEDFPVEHVEEYTLPTHFERKDSNRAFWPATLFGGGYDLNIKNGPRLRFILRVFAEKVIIKMYPLGMPKKWLFPSLCWKFHCPSSVISLPTCLHNGDEEKAELDLDNSSSKFYVVLATAGGSIYRISFPLEQWTSLDHFSVPLASQLSVRVEIHYELRSTHALPLTTFRTVSPEIWIAGSSIGSLFVIQPDKRSSGGDVDFDQFNEIEFRDTNFLKKLALDWMPSWGSRRSRPTSGGEFSLLAIVDICFKVVDDDIYILALHADQKLKIWSVQHASCLQTISAYDSSDSKSVVSHVLPLYRKYLCMIDENPSQDRFNEDTFHYETSSLLSFVVYCSSPDSSFKMFTALLDESHSQTQDHLLIIKRICPFQDDELLDFEFFRGELFTLWETGSTSLGSSPLSKFLVRSMELLTNRGTPSTATRWNVIEHLVLLPEFSLNRLEDHLTSSTYLTSIEEICWQYFLRSDGIVTLPIVTEALIWYEKVSPLQKTATNYTASDDEANEFIDENFHQQGNPLTNANFITDINSLKLRFRKAIHQQVLKQCLFNSSMSTAVPIEENYHELTRLEWLRIISFCNQLSQTNSTPLGLFLSKFSGEEQEISDETDIKGPISFVITHKGFSLSRSITVEESLICLISGSKDLAETRLFWGSLLNEPLANSLVPHIPSISSMLEAFVKLRPLSSLLLSDDSIEIIKCIFGRHVALGTSFLPLNLWEELHEFYSRINSSLTSLQKEDFLDCISRQDFMEMMEFLPSLHRVALTEDSSLKPHDKLTKSALPMLCFYFWNGYPSIISDVWSSMWFLSTLVLTAASLYTLESPSESCDGLGIVTSNVLSKFIQHMRDVWILGKLADKSLLSTWSHLIFDITTPSPLSDTTKEVSAGNLRHRRRILKSQWNKLSFESPIREMIWRQLDFTREHFLVRRNSSSLMFLEFLVARLFEKFQTEDKKGEFLASIASSLYHQGYCYEAYRIVSLASYNTVNTSHVSCQACLRLSKIDQAEESGLLALQFFDIDKLSRIILHDIQNSNLQTSSGMVYHEDYIRYLVEMFELADAKDALIRMIPRILSCYSTSMSETMIHVLRSKLFAYHLEIASFDRAYVSLMAIDDCERREDCLRKFVTVLCEQDKINILCTFPFIGMEEEITKTLEFKARNSPLFYETNYYKVLYAFFVNRMNFRRAAFAMYAYACRLEKEVEYRIIEETASVLTELAKTYLAIIHCLSLVDLDSAWLIRSNERVSAYSGASPSYEVMGYQRSYSTEKENSNSGVPSDAFSRQLSSSNQTIEIIDLTRFRQIYSILLARLKLIQNQPSQEFPSQIKEPEELAAVLSQSNMFDMAFSLCSICHTDPRIIIETLATKCSQLSMMYRTSDPSYQKQMALNILQHTNDPVNISCVNPVDRVWALLHHYLEKQSSSKDLTPIHIELKRCAIERLLSLNRYFQLPSWLTQIFKSETKETEEPHENRYVDLLIRSYLKYDLIEEACLLLIAHLDQLSYRIMCVTRSRPCMIWLPYTSIDYVYKELEKRTREPDSSKIPFRSPQSLLDRLKSCLETYFRLVRQLSDRCRQSASYRTLGDASIL